MILLIGYLHLILKDKMHIEILQELPKLIYQIVSMNH